MKALIIIFLVLFISACEQSNNSAIGNAVESVPPRVFDSALMSLSVVDNVDIEGAYASSKFKDGVCVIKIRRDIYPRCITHEVMHCLSLNWHPNRSTDAFCNQNKI